MQRKKCLVHGGIESFFKDTFSLSPYIVEVHNIYFSFKIRFQLVMKLFL